MLNFIKQVVENHILGFPLPAPPASSALEELAGLGIFVTIKKNQTLRGCIGCTESNEPPLNTLVRYAIAAAKRDPRFTPITTEELPYLSYEITVLYPRELFADLDTLILGEHGVFVQLGSRSALFLPQVALEQNWSKEHFISMCCEKAGLYPGIWKLNSEIKLYKFKGVVIA